MKEIITLVLIWQECTTNNKFRIEENQDEEYQYNKNSTEDIYHELIDYDGQIDQEELDGILENIKRKPNCHQYKDKDSCEYAEE